MTCWQIEVAVVAGLVRLHTVHTHCTAQHSIEQGAGGHSSPAPDYQELVSMDTHRIEKPLMRVCIHCILSNALVEGNGTLFQGTGEATELRNSSTKL